MDGELGWCVRFCQCGLGQLNCAYTETEREREKGEERESVNAQEAKKVDSQAAQTSEKERRRGRR